MNRKSIIKSFPIILLLITHNSLLTAVFGAFKDPQFLARPVGMGGAFTAVADDVSAAWYNPAGIVSVEANSVLFAYSKPFLDLDGVEMSMAYASYLYPMKKYGALCATWARFDTADLYQENTIMVSYARSLGLLDAGLSVKSLGRSVTTDIRTVDDPVFAGGTGKTAFAADIGLLKRWNDKYAAGLSVKNINQPDVGYITSDPVPMETRLGGAGTFEIGGKVDAITASLDAGYRNKEYSISAGGEIWFMDYSLAGRMGFNRNEISLGGSYYYGIPNTSFSLETHYSFSLPFYVEGSAGSHRITIGFQF